MYCFANISFFRMKVVLNQILETSQDFDIVDFYDKKLNKFKQACENHGA